MPLYGQELASVGVCSETPQQLHGRSLQFLVLNQLLDNNLKARDIELKLADQFLNLNLFFSEAGTSRHYATLFTEAILAQKLWQMSHRRAIAFQ